MTRKLFTYGLLLLTIFWLVASYLPEHILLLPKASLEGIISRPTQQIVFVVIMIMFVGIQVSLVFSTNRLFTKQVFKPDLDEARAPEHLSYTDSNFSSVAAFPKAEQFGLKKSSELLWTSVPIIMTLVTVLLAFTVFL